MSLLRSETTCQIGGVLATALAGSWRPFTQEIVCAESSLAEIVPLLIGSMSGALGWWRIRHTALRSSPTALKLQEAYRLHSIGSKLREHSIKQVLSVLYSAGIEPLLVKGWAVARLYPETGLRPYGDIDLLVRREQHALAKKAIRSVDVSYWVDLHAGAGTLDSRPFEELHERSIIVKLDDFEVRVPAPEDHFRLLCVHMLRHSVHRPMWLCDIAAAAECRPKNFDWELCLGKDKTRARWVTCAIGLARRLLGADVSGTPVTERSIETPRWLVSRVLKGWEAPYSMSQVPVTYQAPMAKYIREPRGLLADLGRRWPNPIEATVYVGGPFNELPRWPFQVGECIGRTAKFITRLPSALREGR